MCSGPEMIFFNTTFFHLTTFKNNITPLTDWMSFASSVYTESPVGNPFSGHGSVLLHLFKTGNSAIKYVLSLLFLIRVLRLLLLCLAPIPFRTWFKWSQRIVFTDYYYLNWKEWVEGTRMDETVNQKEFRDNFVIAINGARNASSGIWGIWLNIFEGEEKG